MPLFSETKNKSSVKRKRGCSISRTSSSEEVESAASESDLSETASDTKSQSAAEEPPSKRKREKALKTVAERDRRSGRNKELKKNAAEAEEEEEKTDETTNGGKVPVGLKRSTRARGKEMEENLAKRDADESKSKEKGLEVGEKSTVIEEKSISNFVEEVTKVNEAATTTLDGEEKENETPKTEKVTEESKQDVEVKLVNKRGRKKRGHNTGQKVPESTEGEVDYEPNNKIGRDSSEQAKVKCDEKQKDKKAKSVAKAKEKKAKDGAVKDKDFGSEDDIPLIELRRSSRANKGQRKFEPLIVEEPKKRRRTKEEKKEAEKQAELEEQQRRKEEAELELAAAKAKKVV